jgi:hypothetical protein
VADPLAPHSANGRLSSMSLNFEPFTYVDTRPHSALVPRVLRFSAQVFHLASRRWMTAVLVASLLIGASVSLSSAQEPVAADGPRVELSPTLLQLDGGPQPLRLRAVDLPPFTKLIIELAYDDEISQVTAMGIGSMVASRLVEQEALIIRDASPGRLRFEIHPLAGDPEAEDGDETESTALGDDGEASASAQPLPQGTGELAVITFAPLKSEVEPSDISVTFAELIDAEDRSVTLSSNSAQIAVVTEPDEIKREEYLDQAQAMSELVVPVGRFDGIGNNIGKAYRGLSRRGLGEDGPGPTTAWIGIFLLACLVVAGGWYYGRQPLPSSESTSGWDDSESAGR